MEEHLNDKNRLQEEWTNLCEYEPEPNKCEVGSLPENMTKNRYSNILPCKLNFLFLEKHSSLILVQSIDLINF